MIAVLLDIRPTKMRIVKLLAVLITSMHLYACAFWKARLLAVPYFEAAPCFIHLLRIFVLTIIVEFHPTYRIIPAFFSCASTESKLCLFLPPHRVTINFK
jgi:hypothetical protein